MKRVFLAAVCLALSAAAAPAAERIKIASFSTVLTEIAQQVGGGRVEVAGLVLPGVDPHEYEPTPADLKQVGDAGLILTSGKHLENYVDKLQEATGGKADLLKVGDGMPSLMMKEEEGGGQGQIEDPHWWHSVGNMKEAAKEVRDELIKLDPAGKTEYEQRTEAYLANLESLESWVKRKVAELPRDKRKLVTSHDAFQYFARDFGFEIFAIEGVSTETEPSNRHVAELIDAIKEQGVKAIFLESTLNPKVTKEITRETGVAIGGTLYADGLGTGDASTYEGMMKHNVSTIVEALK